FSGLYGHWYPHGHDDTTCLRALWNECLGTALAMREIRAVNPAARLVQTEDMGETFSTPLLASQARFENQRRWIALDLLAGRGTATKSRLPSARSISAARGKGNCAGCSRRGRRVSRRANRGPTYRR